MNDKGAQMQKIKVIMIMILIVVIFLQISLMIRVNDLQKYMSAAYDTVYQRLEVNAIKQNEIKTILKEAQEKGLPTMQNGQ